LRTYIYCIVKIWDTRKTFQPVLNLKGHHQDVTDVKYSPDGKHLISVSKDGSIKSWNLTENDNKKSIISEISTGKVLTSLIVSNIQKDDLNRSSESKGGYFTVKLLHHIYIFYYLYIYFLYYLFS
jgi:WD40 repeat protein